MTIYYSAKSRTANHPQVSKTTINSIVIGKREVCRSIVGSISQRLSRKKGSYLLAIDGYLGTDWKNIIEELRNALADKHIESKTIDISSCLKKPPEIDKIIHPYLKCDPYFGFVFNGKLEQFFDSQKLEQIEKELQDFQKTRLKPADIVVICYGIGSALPQLSELFDSIVYFDLTREELFNRSEDKPISCLGSKDGDGPVHKNFKRFCYIDSIVLDKHKKKVLKKMNWYVDGNSINEPKIIPRNSYEEILSGLPQLPIIVKQLYYPVVWGGNWQKKLKNLPNSMENSGQGSIVPNESSIEIILGKFYLDIPFQNLLWHEPIAVLGHSAYEITHGRFPLSYFYDDEIEGGHMAIQVHPDENYIRKNFNEFMRQDESYYILHTGPCSKTYLGLKEDANLSKFHREAIISEKKGIPFDYEQYVNGIETKPGDFLLIPAGTIHASGKNQMVIEIDWVNTAYTPGYTFHIYDYVRPDLDGTLRSMHIKHAFNVIKEERRRNWAQKYLKQKPRLIRKGRGWAEYVIGSRKDMLFDVHRLEFQEKINDKTDKKKTFHALTLVEGKSIIIKPRENPDRRCRLDFPDTLVIPACMGKYTIINLGKKPCKVVKALVKS